MIIVPLAKLLMSLVLYIKCINQFKFKEQYNVHFFFEHSSSGDGDSEGGGDNDGGGGGGHVFHPPRNMVLDPSLK